MDKLIRFCCRKRQIRRVRACTHLISRQIRSGASKRAPCLIIVALGLFAAAAPALAQFKQNEDAEGPKVGDARVSQWRTGVMIKAANGPCNGLAGYIPVPTDWPEQEVKVMAEEISPEVRVSYEMVDGGVKLMNVRIGRLAVGQEAKALVTVEVRRSVILPPEKTDSYVIPDPKKISRNLRPYLAPSPKIESRDQKIRDLAKKIGEDKQKAWERVEAIYDEVREKVKYKTGSPLLGALAALRSGEADCEDMTSLFIALCRASNVPARTVWVPGHCYPEFYLEDSEGKGHWFPCQIAGSREFGGITETRPILQKGDNFRPPKGGRERQRYMAEHMAGSGSQPHYRFVRETVGK